MGKNIVKFKKFNEIITYNKNKTNLNNLFFGKMVLFFIQYTEHIGGMDFKNHTTGESAKVEYISGGWTEKSFKV